MSLTQNDIHWPKLPDPPSTKLFSECCNYRKPAHVTNPIDYLLTDNFVGFNNYQVGTVKPVKYKKLNHTFKRKRIFV